MGRKLIFFNLLGLILLGILLNPDDWTGVVNRKRFLRKEEYLSFVEFAKIGSLSEND